MNSSEPYPRDLIGYGSHPPHPRWPQDARIAVSVVLNYEEGGEYCVLHGDAHSESVLADVAAEPLQNARNLNVESNFEYGSRVGFWEIMRLLREHGVDATINAVGMALERNPEAAEAIAQSGLEVAAHGQRWIDYQFVPEAAERADMLRNIEVITRMIGRRPLGWYNPAGQAPIRVDWWLKSAVSCMTAMPTNDDLPYWTHVAGRPHLVIPHTFDANDSRMQRGGDFSTGEEFFAYCRDAFDWLYRMGTAGRPRMMTISLHGRIIGRPGRIGALARTLDHIRRHDAVWLCNRAAIAQHWTLHHASAHRP